MKTEEKNKGRSEDRNKMKHEKKLTGCTETRTPFTSKEGLIQKLYFDRIVCMAAKYML